jgi:hypothetical protein
MLPSEPTLPPVSGGPGPVGCGQLLQVAVPLTTIAGALMIGLVLGSIAGWVVSQKQPQPIEYRQTASLAELHNQCDPLVTELQTQLANLVGEIEMVKGQLSLKESDLLVLEPLVLAQGSAPSALDGRNYAAEREAAWLQAAELSTQLRLLERTRGNLVEQLTRVRERMLVEDEQLAQQVAISDLLRDERGRLHDPDVLAAWFAFVSDSQTRICGPDIQRRGLDCRAAVQRELPAIKEAFVRCLRAGQPAPVAERVEEGAELPPFAHGLNPSSEFVAGWAFLLCNPGQPEN